MSTLCIIAAGKPGHATLNLKDKSKSIHKSQKLSTHTIRKCKNMVGQNTFPILLFNNANMM
jgi:hypothetical protein